MYRILRSCGKHCWNEIQRLRFCSNSAQILDPKCSNSVYIETYGCQMNVSDSEVVLSILQEAGYQQTRDLDEANVILLNTCAIREKPESKIWRRLEQIRNLQGTKGHKSVVGVLGCMAERVKDRLLDREKLADLVVGPDAYRDLPNLLTKLQESENEGVVNVELSLEETYADITPLRPRGKVSAFLTIMRGCNNMCSFCIVPYTRGRERSRSMESILNEAKMLREQGVKDITLLGQNVNSYCDDSSSTVRSTDSKDAFSVYAKGFSSVYKPRRRGNSFATLLDSIADLDDELRIRFTSPHPKDFNDDVIEVVRSRHNVCNQLHVPAQSGSSLVLDRMRRGYTREACDQLIDRIRHAIPNIALSTDIIVGFSHETEEEHQATLDLMRETKFDQAFMFKYSEREKTHAHRHWPDDVPSETKQRRLQEVIDVFRDGLNVRNQAEVGKRHLVLVEDNALKDSNSLTGRSDTFKRVNFVKEPIPNSLNCDNNLSVPKIGDYVLVEVTSATHGTLFAKPLTITSLKQSQHQL